MFKRIAVVNLSRTISPSEASKMVTACNTQLARDVAPAWGKSYIPVVLYSNNNSVPADSGKIFIYDNSNQADTLGYHTISGTQAWGVVFSKTITDWGCPKLYDPTHRSLITVSSVLSHEIIEMFVDPFANAWADGPSILEGSEYAIEACDAVEASTYQITLPSNNGYVSVSNFLYPEYFNSGSSSVVKMDYLGAIRAPFTLSRYGYMIVRRGPGQETAIFGAEYPAVLKALNEHAKS